MKFYEALKYLLTTSGLSRIGRKAWGVGLKWVCKGTYSYNPNEEDEEIRNTLYIVTSMGGQETETMYHANPVDMLAEDWYIL